MKLVLRHFSVRPASAFDAWVGKQILALEPLRAIEEARVRLARRRERSPAYEVHVHLVTPGPDVFAVGRDHTLRAAVAKVLAQLRGKLSARLVRRQRKEVAFRRGPDALRKVSATLSHAK